MNNQDYNQAIEIILLARQIHFHYNDALGKHGLKLNPRHDGALSFDAAVRLATKIVFKDH